MLLTYFGTTEKLEMAKAGAGEKKYPVIAVSAAAVDFTVTPLALGTLVTSTRGGLHF